MFFTISVSHCLQFYLTLKDTENQFIISIISVSIFAKGYGMYTNFQNFCGLSFKILEFSSIKIMFTFSTICATMYLVRNAASPSVFILINEIIFHRSWIFCPNDGLK